MPKRAATPKKSKGKQPEQIELFKLPSTEPSTNAGGLEPTQIKKPKRTKRDHTPPMVDKQHWVLCPRFTVYNNGIVIFNLRRWLDQTASDWFVNDPVSLRLLAERGISAQDIQHGMTIEKRLLVIFNNRATGQPFISDLRSPDSIEEMTYIANSWFDGKFIPAELRERYLRDALWPLKTIEDAARRWGYDKPVELVSRYFRDGTADQRRLFIEAERRPAKLSPRDRHVIDPDFLSKEYREAMAYD